MTLAAMRSLSALRNEAGLSRERLAREAHVTESLVNKMEHGACLPSTYSCARLAEALDRHGIAVPAIELKLAAVRDAVAAKSLTASDHRVVQQFAATLRAADDDAGVLADEVLQALNAPHEDPSEQSDRDLWGRTRQARDRVRGEAARPTSLSALDQTRDAFGRRRRHS